jgi:hypothetical protein
MKQSEFYRKHNIFLEPEKEEDTEFKTPVGKFFPEFNIKSYTTPSVSDAGLQNKSVEKEPSLQRYINLFIDKWENKNYYHYVIVKNNYELYTNRDIINLQFNNINDSSDNYIEPHLDVNNSTWRPIKNQDIEIFYYYCKRNYSRLMTSKTNLNYFNTASLYAYANEKYQNDDNAKKNFIKKYCQKNNSSDQVLLLEDLSTFNYSPNKEIINLIDMIIDNITEEQKIILSNILNTTNNLNDRYSYLDSKQFH